MSRAYPFSGGSFIDEFRRSRRHSIRIPKSSRRVRLRLCSLHRSVPAIPFEHTF